MTVSSDETVLVIDDIAFPPGSGYEVNQTLDPIDGIPKPRRDINRRLINTAINPAQNEKYKSTITFGDQRPPAVDGVWIGKELVVDCVNELWFVTHSAGPSKPVVPGSEYEEGPFTFYRPRLTMMITGGPRNTYNERGAVAGCEIDLEEI